MKQLADKARIIQEEEKVEEEELNEEMEEGYKWLCGFQ